MDHTVLVDIKSSKLCTYTKRYVPKLTPHTHADLGSHLVYVPFVDVHDLLLLEEDF